MPIVVLDVAKGFVPALVGTLVANELVGALAGGAAMLGHWRPLFLRFQKGGKTVATGGGALVGLAPVVGLIGLVLWLVLFVATRYASVASMATAAALPFIALALGEPWPVVVFVSLAAVAILAAAPGEHRAPAVRHREPLPVAPRLKRQAERSHSASEVWRGAGMPDSSSPRSSATVPSRSARTSWVWMVSKLTWRAKRKSSSRELRERVQRALQREPNRVLDEARLQVRVLDDEQLVGPLEQLVDRRAHRALDDPDEVVRVELPLRPTRSVPRPRWLCVASGTSSRIRSTSS